MFNISKFNIFKYKKLLLKHFFIYFIFIISLLFIIKVGYINNILYSITNQDLKSLNFLKYNNDITKKIKNNIEILGFQDNLNLKLKNDYFFTAYYTISFEATSGLYNKSLNTLFITDDISNYDEKNIKNILKLNNSTIRHELIHYFLNRDNNFKEKVFSIQNKIFLNKKNQKLYFKYLNYDYHKDKAELIKYLKTYASSPIDILNVVIFTKEYNPKQYSAEYIFQHFNDYKTDPIINNIREELLTFYFENISYSKMKKEYINTNKNVLDLYLLFFKDSYIK